jgi:TolA-binding protein
LTGQQMTPTAAPVAPDAYIKVANDYPGTEAGQRALLIGASDLFAAGKYDDAQGQFQKFIQQYANSPFTAQAALGIASCYDAEGKTNDAVNAYQGVIDRYGTQNVVPQAKLSLARLLESQGKFKEAQNTFEELARTVPGSIGSEANERLRVLMIAHPELQPTNPPPSAAAPAINLKPVK